MTTGSGLIAENQRYMSKLERRKTAGTGVPGFTPDFGSRLASIVELLGGARSTAELVQVTPEQLSKWRTGKARMPFGAAMTMCEAAGESLDWLAFGVRDPLHGAPRSDERLDDIAQRLDEARALFDKAEKAAGWQPPPIVAENLRSLLVGARLQRLDVEHVAQLLDALKRWHSDRESSGSD